MNTSVTHRENADKTVLVKGIQIMGPADIKTETTNQQSTDSQAVIISENTDVALPNCSKETSVTEEEHPSGATRTSLRQKKQPQIINEAIPSNLFNKEQACDKLRTREFKSVS